MPWPPRPITQRHAQRMVSTETRLRKLESRTMGIDSGWPLAMLPGVIPSTYVAGGPPAANPTVFINGAATATGPYQYLASYTPAPGDSVLLAPVGVTSTYVVIGKVQ